MSYNPAARPRENHDRISVDLAASGVAYKERLNLPVNPAEVGRQQHCASISGSCWHFTAMKR